MLALQAIGHPTDADGRQISSYAQPSSHAVDTDADGRQISSYAQPSSHAVDTDE